VLYIDQPVGTGFSYTKRNNYCGNDEAVNTDFYSFLKNFLSVYHEYFLKDVSSNKDDIGSSLTLNRKLFFSGESHAGHYIPSMIDYIYRKNDDVNSPPTIQIPIAGAALGNPWTDPFHQYAAADIAYGYGFIDNAQKAHLDDLEVTCRKSIIAWMKDSSSKPRHCLELVSKAVKASGGAKSYNINVWGTEYPPGKATMESYLRGEIGGDSSAIVKSLHLQGSENFFGRYSECSDPPYNALFHQDALGVVDELVRVLDHPTKPRILFYFGMADFVCNHVSGEKMLNALPWSRAPSWALAERYAWQLSEARSSSTKAAPAGYAKEFENLVLLKIPEAGHMLPLELPEVTLEMMRTLLGPGCFRGSVQQLDRVYPTQMYLPGQCVDCPNCDDIFRNTIVCSPSNISPPSQEEASILPEAPKSSDERTTSAVLSKGAVIGAAFTFFLIMSIYTLVSSDPRKDGAIKLEAKEVVNAEKIKIEMSVLPDTAEMT